MAERCQGLESTLLLVLALPPSTAIAIHVTGGIAIAASDISDVTIIFYAILHAVVFSEPRPLPKTIEEAIEYGGFYHYYPGSPGQTEPMSQAPEPL